MSNRNLKVNDNKNCKDIKHDDSVRINIEEDAPVEPLHSRTESKNTEVTNIKIESNKDKKETVENYLDEIQQVSGCSNEKYDLKDVSSSKDRRVRRKRRTVIYIYLCPRFDCNLFSRTRHQHVETKPQSQRRRYGFTDGSFTVFKVDVKSKGVSVNYGEVDEEENRNLFVRKTFSICSLMLVATLILTTLAVTVVPIREFMSTKPALILVALAFSGTLFVQYAFCCCVCTRMTPLNYLLNIFVTMCFSFVASFLSARYAPLVGITAASLTLLAALICLGLAYTTFDFTRFILPFTIALISFIAATVVCVTLIFVFSVKVGYARMIVLTLSAVCSSTMLIVESQMILGGKTVEIGEDDFAFAAYMIYTSIINIFLKVLGVINIATTGEE